MFTTFGALLHGWLTFASCATVLCTFKVMQSIRSVLLEHNLQTFLTGKPSLPVIPQAQPYTSAELYECILNKDFVEDHPHSCTFAAIQPPRWGLVKRSQGSRNFARASCETV